MPLEKAGVELVAKNYRAYIQHLREIDKEQQRVFRDQGRGAVRGHQAAQNAARNHARQVQGLGNAYKALQGIIVAVFASRVFQEAAEAVEKAFDFRRLSAQFENLAQSSGQSADELLAAFQRGAQGTISTSRAVASAMAAMRLEVAQTPGEMEELVRLAVALRPAGKSAADAVDELVTALGRRSLLVLDNFNISSRQARAEMERLAQVKFGQNLADLDQAAKDALFMEAALTVARRQFEAMGGDIAEIGNDMERMQAAAENLKLVLGEALVPGAGTLGGKMAEVLDTLAKIVALSAAGAAGFDAMIKSLSGGTAGLLQLLAVGPAAIPGLIAQVATGGGEGLTPKELFDQSLLDFQEAYNERLKGLTRAMGILSDETGDAAAAQDGLGDSIEDNTKEIEAQQKAVEQAAQIQRNYGRAVDDALRRAGRAAEKLQRRQAKELVKLQKKLNEQLADLETERIEETADLEKERAKDIARERENLHKRLQQEEERFNLSQMQNRRRFNLQDRRLRAEGDILALQQLREDYDLQKKEERENFDLSQRQQKESSADQLRQQEDDFRERVKQLGDELDKRRAEILSSYDEELAELQAHHAEQREEQARSLREQLEDLRLNRARQIEDLGYHLAQQEDITRQGAQNVADELAKVFGDEGVATLIMQGYFERTESGFAELFDSLEKTAAASSSVASVPELTPRQQAIGIQHGFAGVVTGPQAFMVEPGVNEFVYAAPLSGGGAHNVNVNMRGGFDIRGAAGASPGAVDAALDNMVLEFETAIRRVVRRG